MIRASLWNGRAVCNNPDHWLCEYHNILSVAVQNTTSKAHDASEVNLEGIVCHSTRIFYGAGRIFSKQTIRQRIKPARGAWELQVVPSQYHALRHFHLPFKLHACLVRDLHLSLLTPVYQISCHAQRVSPSLAIFSSYR